jgi:hypothetical protein
MRSSAWILQVLCPLLFVSCMRERPRDLRLERLYVEDMSRTSYYGAMIARGLLPPLFLTVELSTTEAFPTGARMVWGFCGGKMIPTNLVALTNPNAEADSGPPTREGINRHWFSAVVPLSVKFVPPRPELLEYDITNDSRDICLTTGSGTYSDVWKSNEVRIPRSLIETALHEPVYTHLPLHTN